MKYHLSLDIDFKRNPYKGFFIAIEGIDGSGKTTQARLIAEKLSQSLPAGRQVSLTKNPTNSPVAKLADKVIKKQIEIPVVSLQYLFAADRQIHQLEITKDLKEGKIVISDRYFWSSVAYGLADRSSVDYDKNGNVLLVAQSILSMYHQFLVPDLTIYLDVPVKLALNRISKIHRTSEYYEKEEKLAKVAKGYQWLAKKFPKEIISVDGTKKETEITKEILKLLKTD